MNCGTLQSYAMFLARKPEGGEVGLISKREEGSRLTKEERMKGEVQVGSSRLRKVEMKGDLLGFF